eukprot:GHVL01015250.1.p1 GENE.GHVL01015250.1~~GHVL01015250.1.p1  ORF type:complete len:331 (+),score=57.94 GHVL01015250.1:27-1019(+)
MAKPPKQKSTHSTTYDENNQSNENTISLPHWKSFFDRNITISLNEDKFNIYEAGNEGPLLFFFHGGGHTALSWGHVAHLLKSKMQVFAFDSRGHGNTECAVDDYSATQLTNDGINIINFIFQKIENTNPCPIEENQEIGPKKDRPKGHNIIICGHSMGGAIAARVAASKKIPNLKGVIVLDVVEGTAMQALPFMRGIISNIPKSFDDVMSAVNWATQSGTIKNKDSAALSIPSQLLRKNDKWIWRCDLMNTADYWEGWFEGLSKVFLSAPCTKCLVVVGPDRLDKELMIAQMQGKFQYTVVGDSGHVIEEDNPGKVAQIIIEFAQRYKVS